MTVAQNRELLKRFYDEGWNANNVAVYDELVTEDFVDHQAQRVTNHLGQFAVSLLK